MNKYPRIVGYLQLHNELEQGNLRRVLINMAKIVGHDQFVIYDDGSTDDSQLIYPEFTSHVIHGKGGEFTNELFIKKRLMQYALEEMGAEWVVWEDGDCIFDAQGTDHFAIQDLILRGEVEGVYGWGTHWKNCYLHPRWYRVDNQFNDFGQVNIFKLTKQVYESFQPSTGLHQKQTPDVPMRDQDEVEIFHLGFASPKAIEAKYRMYHAHGQRHWALERIIHTGGLDLRLIPEECMPFHYRPEAGARPDPVDFGWLKKELPPWGLDEQWIEDYLP